MLPNQIERLLELTQSWAIKQLHYDNPNRILKNYPRNLAVQSYFHAKITVGLAQSLPKSNTIALLKQIFEQAISTRPQFYDEDKEWWLEKAFIQLSHAFAYLGEYGLALDVAKSIEYDRQIASTIAQIAVIAFKQNYVNLAQEIWNDAINHLLDRSFVSIFTLAFEYGDLDFMEWVASNCAYPLTVHQQELVGYLVKHNFFDEAEKLAREFNLQHETHIALCYISEALASIDYQRSHKLMLEAEEIIPTLEKEDDYIRVYSALMVATFHLQDEQRFDDYRTKAQELVEQYYPQSVPSPLSDYVVALAKVGYVEEAQKVANSIGTKGKGTEPVKRSVIEHDLFQYFVETQQYSHALSTARLLESSGEGMDSDLYWGTRTLIRLAVKLIKENQISEAKKLLDEIILKANQSDSVTLQRFMGYSITQLLARFQRYSEMFELLDKAGIDRFAIAISSAAKYFEEIEGGLSLKILKIILQAGANKYEDYNLLLSHID